MRKRWVYRIDRSGHCRAIPVETIPYRSGETLPDMEQRVKSDLYALECQEGSRFNGIGEFSTNTLKRVWVDNVERDAAFDRRREHALQEQRKRLGYG